MFGLLHRWRNWRDKRQRQIFSYWDGSRQRSADPLEVARALDYHPKFSAKLHIPLIESGDDDALQITLGAVRDVFGVPAWSEKTPGLTQQETIDLLDRFVTYLDDLKKNIKHSPTTAPPTTLASSGDRSHMPSMSACD